MAPTQSGGHSCQGSTRNFEDPKKIKSDLYTDGSIDKYVFTDNDIKIINNFFSNIKGANSEHYEFSNPDDSTLTDTKFNVFVDKLQKIIVSALVKQR